MRSRLLLPLLIALLAGVSASAQNTTVRVLFYTGEVTVKSGKSSQKASIGQQLEPRDELTLPRGGTVQLSVNGKVIKYSKAGKVRVADAIKRAGTGENSAVANTVRTLAAASGADRNNRSSQAGATRLDDSSNVVTKGKKKIKKKIASEANREIAERTGIDDPLGKAEKIATLITGENDMIILAPRSTAIPSGPVRFRWLRSPSAGSYIVSVKNYLGEEIFRQETADTSLEWHNAELPPEVIYTWTLTDTKNKLHGTGAMFHRLADSADAALRSGTEAIRAELGADNPALPLMLAACYADNGCYGDAARLYTEGAQASRQHYRELMLRACDQYLYQMYMPEEEVMAVYRGR